jgi:thiamine-phosphate diphosphorylase / hydroxyethylthiazole kinase
VNVSNIGRIFLESGTAGKNLSGVAVVSAIMAAPNPETAAREILGLLRTLPPLRRNLQGILSANDVVAVTPAIIKAIHHLNPLSHNMTNLVVQNFAANVALAVGASPIMSNYGAEAEDLARLGGALVINMGTVTPQALENYIEALKTYNAVGQPIVLDPVG